jgi:hypothetical protein
MRGVSQEFPGAKDLRLGQHDMFITSLLLRYPHVRPFRAAPNISSRANIEQAVVMVALVLGLCEADHPCANHC